MSTYVIRDEEQASSLNITTRLLVLEALRRGWHVEYTQAYPDESDSGMAHCTKNDKELFFDSDLTALTPVYGFWAANNKNLTYGLLVKNSVPTPHTRIISIDAPDGELMEHLDAMSGMVVKPLATNHGVGITVGVHDLENLKRAITNGKQYSKSGYILLQEQVYGDEYRFLVLDNEVIAVAGRQPACVTGDGRLSVRELIEDKNLDERRGEGHKASLTKISIDDVVTARGERLLSVIPDLGEKVALLDTSNLSRGGEAIDYTDVVHDSLKAIAVSAAKACGLGLAGVDIMTDDITMPAQGRSYVIEVNLAPGLRMHHFPSQGSPRDVASMIFEKMEERANRDSMRCIGVPSFADKDRSLREDDSVNALGRRL